MANDSLKKTDLASDDFLSNIIPTQVQLDNINQLFDTFDNLATLMESNLGNYKGNLKAMKEQADIQAKLSKLTKEKAAFDGQKLILEQRLIKEQKKNSIEEERLAQARLNTKTKEYNLTLKEIKEKERLEKIRVKELNTLTKQNSVYAQQSARLNDLRKQYKDVALTQGENSKAAKNLLKQITPLDARLKSIDATVGQNQRSVGNYSKAVQGLTGVLSKLGIAFGVSQLFRNFTGVIVDYNQAQTDLIAITQKSAEELSGLTQQARELGATTQFSATQITQLQIELAKLGFTTQEIMDSTGGIANFAAATGVEIPRAAKLAGSALRAFNLEATEIDRVVSTLGVATTKTALDFSQLETGLSTVAPVAASFGFTIEDTTALLGQLSNAGFDASSAATATRNILLNLADANGELAQQLGRPITNAEDLAAGLKELQSQGVDLAEALELTDKRSVAAFSTFITGADNLVGLRDSITDVNDELNKMAADRLNSVSGQMKILNSAWEEYILNLDETYSISKTITSSLGFIAKNLGTIIKVIIGGLKAWALQRVAVKLLRFETDAAGKSIARGLIPSIIASGKALISSIKGFKLATLSAKGFGAALKSIPLVGIISGITTVISLFWDNTEATDANTAATDANTEAQEGLNAELQKRIAYLTELNKLINEGQKDIENLATEDLKDLADGYKAALAESQGLVDIFNIQDKSLSGSQSSFEDYLLTLLKSTDLTNEGVTALHARRDALLNLAKVEDQLAKRGAGGSPRKTTTPKAGISDAEKAELERIKAINKGEEDYAEQKRQREQQRVEDINNSEEKANAEQLAREKERVDKLNREQEDYADQQLKRNQEIIDAEKKNAEELAELRQKLAEQGIEAIDSYFDKKIDSIKKEADASKAQQDFLKDLASSGNITAQQSLKSEIEAQREAEKELIEIEKKKATIKLITTGLNTFSSEIDSGKTPAEAFASTLVSVEALKTVLSGMNFFATGTDNAPKGTAVVDELGAEIHLDKAGNIKSLGSDKGANFRHLDKGDKIIPHKESKNILNYIGKIDRPKEMMRSKSSSESFATIARLDKIADILKSKNDSAAYDPLFNELVRTSRNGGVRIKNRYRS